jgi:hypothetical protein
MRRAPWMLRVCIATAVLMAGQTAVTAETRPLGTASSQRHSTFPQQDGTRASTPSGPSTETIPPQRLRRDSRRKRLHEWGFHQPFRMFCDTDECPGWRG